MSFFVVQFLIFLLILFLLYLLSWFLPTDSPWSPWWATSKEIARRAFRIGKVKKTDVIYELGSGTGTAMVVAIEDFHVKKAVGIESSISRVWWSKQKAKRVKQRNNLTFLRDDFFKRDLSSATVVYFYLVPRVISKLKKKLLKELKPGTKVISYIYWVDYLPLVAKDAKKEIYVYKIPDKRKIKK